MSIRLFLFLILCLFPVFFSQATDCTDVFPGPQSFAVKGSLSTESGVTCNGTSCSAAGFTEVTLKSISNGGDFNASTISDGVTDYNGWGLGDNKTVTYTGAGNGTAVLYFKDNDVVLKKGVKINQGGDPANVLLVFKGKLKIEENARINAFIYVKGNELTIEKDSEIDGGIAAKKDVILKENSTFTYTPSDLNNLDSQDFCDQSAPSVHHYEIVHDGSGSVCVAETVTVKACLDGACSSLSTDAITLEFQAGGITKTTPSFTGSTSFTFDHTTAETLSLSVANPTVTATNAPECDSGGGTSCDISFSSTGCSNVCSAYFPNTVQGHDANSSLKFKNNGQVVGDAANLFAFPSLTDETDPSHNTCASADCAITSTTAAALTLPVFETTSTTTDIALSAGTSTIGPGGDYNLTEIDQLSLTGNANVTFLSSPTDYKITTGYFHNNSIITLNAGTYWFDFLEIFNSSQVIINGPVVIYVNQHFDIENNSLVNVGGVARNLAFIGYEQIHLKNEVQVKAVLYGAGQDIHIHNNARHTGVISAKGKLEIKNSASANYEGIAGLTLNGLCEAVTDIHHYQIIHNNQGLTCADEEITINACEVADCSVLSTQNVTMDVYAGSTKIADALSFQGTSTFDFTYSTAETISLSLDNISPGATDDPECSYANCEITFSDADFSFSTITNQVAGVEFTDIVLTATKSKRAGAGFSCISDDTFVSKTVTIDLAQENIAPTGTGGLLFTVDSDASSLAKYPSFTSVELVFDAEAKAIIPKPNYKDAGQIRLQASYNNGGTDITGSSNSFWVRPDALKLSVQADGTKLDAATVDANPSHKAGADFDFNVTAINADGDTTLNYAPGQIQLKLERTGPTSGSNEGNFTYAASNSLPSSLTPAFVDVTLTSFTAGNSSYSGAKYSDVGLLNLDIQDSAYGDGSLTIAAGAIDIGRFVPDHFTLFSSQVSGWCGAGDPENFVYMDQEELKISYQLQALNQGGEVTKNYFDHVDSAQDYAKAGITLVAENNNDGNELASRLSGFSSNWLEGVYALDNSKGNFSRGAAAPDGPFEDLVVGIGLDDGETPTQVSLLTGLDMRPDTDNACTTETDPATDCSAKQLSGSANIRFGRWYVENNFGPETEDLPIVMSVQYWDGSGFITNLDDSCTPYNGETVNNYAFDTTGLNPALAANPDINATTGTGTFLNGSNSLSPLILAAPGAENVGNTYYIYGGTNDVTPSWLKYDWDSDTNHDNNPKGLASFGQYRGNDRILYWREIN
ncbi:DUF6701 domain-containing protein [Thalassomonas haliotis]|uniref:MSHA biogenesis protein MshQ n=1 Tax=Thalassomonas haliotis TaxID=485448 RepID=A0ABY7VKA0_9GAMM|nr:DUF6701 domain-containing protein [Thalassomonas haliotis]WDE14011.1 hypothetical protein H3N35_11545 [Thalassomonas haliotis]